MLPSPQLRRRDHEDVDQREVHGAKSNGGEPDLLINEEVDEAEERHMFLPSYQTTFWGTTMAFFLSPSLTAQPPSPMKKSFQAAVEPIESLMVSSVFDSFSEGPMQELDEDRTYRQDLNADIKLRGELYPRYSLDKLIQSNKLAEFSVVTTQEPRSLEAVMVKNGLSLGVHFVPAQADGIEIGQDTSERTLNKMSAMPMWRTTSPHASKPLLSTEDFTRH
jgi:hypothetical protein